MTNQALTRRITRVETSHLLRRIADLEAQLEQQEESRMYHVVFDVRELTHEERSVLEAINTRLMSEQAEPKS